VASGSRVGRWALCAAISSSSVVLGACISVSDDGDYEYAQPYPSEPWYADDYAPALIFDPGLGLYSVHGYPDLYFFEGYYYRWGSGYWHRSHHWRSGWERCDSRWLPRPIHLAHGRRSGGDHHFGRDTGWHAGPSQHRGHRDRGGQRDRQTWKAPHQSWQPDRDERHGGRHHTDRDAGWHGNPPQHRGRQDRGWQQGRETREPPQQRGHAERRDRHGRQHETRDRGARERPREASRPQRDARPREERRHERAERADRPQRAENHPRGERQERSARHDRAARPARRSEGHARGERPQRNDSPGRGQQQAQGRAQRGWQQR